MMLLNLSDRGIVMTKVVKIGNKVIGGKNPVLIQSMTTTRTQDAKMTIEQIKALTTAGCDIVRVTVPDMEAAKQIDKIKENITIPLVADIHFDYRVALECMDRGVDKVRINPGNIGDSDRVKAVAERAIAKNVPIRIGVNGGSLDKDILNKYGRPCADAMVESGLKEIKALEQFGMDNIVISLKSSTVIETVDAYRKISKLTDYPLHIGITESGTEYGGLIKSSVGLGSLILDGIGDTIRVSLTADPVREVYAAKEILKACGKIKGGVNLISCPTCGRCCYPLIDIVNSLEPRLKVINKDITVAVMGCVVNGPGEAREADIGIAGGKDECILFKKGEIVGRVGFDNVIDVLLNEIEKM